MGGDTDDTQMSTPTVLPYKAWKTALNYYARQNQLLAGLKKKTKIAIDSEKERGKNVAQNRLSEILIHNKEISRNILEDECKPHNVMVVLYCHDKKNVSKENLYYIRQDIPQDKLNVSNDFIGHKTMLSTAMNHIQEQGKKTKYIHHILREVTKTMGEDNAPTPTAPPTEHTIVQSFFPRESHLYSTLNSVHSVQAMSKYGWSLKDKHTEWDFSEDHKVHTKTEKEEVVQQHVHVKCGLVQPSFHDSSGWANANLVKKSEECCLDTAFCQKIHFRYGNRDEELIIMWFNQYANGVKSFSLSPHTVSTHTTPTVSTHTTPTMSPISVKNPHTSAINVSEWFLIDGIINNIKNNYPDGMEKNLQITKISTLRSGNEKVCMVANYTQGGESWVTAYSLAFPHRHCDGGHKKVTSKPPQKVKHETKNSKPPNPQVGMQQPKGPTLSGDRAQGVHEYGNFDEVLHSWADHPHVQVPESVRTLKNMVSHTKTGPESNSNFCQENKVLTDVCEDILKNDSSNETEMQNKINLDRW